MTSEPDVSSGGKAMPKFSERQITVLRYVCAKSPIDSPFRSMLSVRGISSALGIPRSCVHEDLKRLRQEGCVHLPIDFEATAFGHEVLGAAIAEVRRRALEDPDGLHPDSI